MSFVPSLEDRVTLLEKQCGQMLQLIEDLKKAPPPRTTGPEVPVRQDMRDQAFLFSKDPNCKPEWKKFLTDMQTLRVLSAGQGKFWAVIHKELTGAWPLKEPVAMAAQRAAAADDEAF